VKPGRYCICDFPSVAQHGGKKTERAKKTTNVAKLLRRGDCGVKGKRHKM